MFYAYMRCSTKSQMEDNGFQMQENVIENYCKENNIEITDIYTDGGISGTKYDRNGIMDLIAILQKGDKIIVQNTSRIWREEFATAFIKRELRKIGAIIISIENPAYDLYTNDPGDIFMARIIEAVDEFERLQIALKLAKGRKAKANKGNKACGTAPYGYKWDNAKIVIDYNNNLIVEDIYIKYIELNYSLAKLQRYCESKGYKTSAGNDFSKQALKNILTNDFYTGIVTHAGKKSIGEHTPIISKELFEKVQNKEVKSA